MLNNKPVNLMKPLFHVVERVDISDIVDNNNTMSTTVITGCDGAESFLTGSIPLNKLKLFSYIKYATTQ